VSRKGWCPDLPAMPLSLNLMSLNLATPNSRWAFPPCQAAARTDRPSELSRDCLAYSGLPSRVACCFQESDCLASSSPGRFQEPCSLAQFR
jgi:hypothetical protein